MEIENWVTTLFAHGHAVQFSNLRPKFNSYLRRRRDSCTRTSTKRLLEAFRNELEWTCWASKQL